MSYIKSINRVINLADNLTEISKHNYITCLNKLFDYLDVKKISQLKDIELIKNTIFNNYSNLETRKAYFNAVIKYLELSKCPKKIISEYNDIRLRLRKDISKKNFDNVIDDKGFISLEELENVPKKIQSDIINLYGSLFVKDLEKLRLDDKKYKNYQKLLTDWMFIYLTINYPLRLDYYNLQIKNSDDNINLDNYIVLTDKGFILYLNKFKTVKTLGKQVITYDDELIKEYIDELRLILNKEPDYLYLWYYKNNLSLFNKLITYSHNITNIIKRYTGLHINNNMIRKIHSTAMINDDKYKELTNAERDKLHKKLLHSATTANAFYKKVKKNNIIDESNDNNEEKLY